MIKYSAPCLFGLEGPVADELRRLGMSDVLADNGRVGFSGSAADLARANISLRTAERVLVEIGSFPAPSFDALFEGVKALPWEDYIPVTGAFPVRGHSLDSALHSIPDCQRIVKKALAERLGSKYGQSWLPEDGALYQVQFAIMKDRCVMYIDSSGAGLHKRGYRPAGGDAPLRETLAAGMVSIAKYRGRGDFADPFCGSGTIAIEAALMAKNRAPGLNRTFSAEAWRDSAIGLSSEEWHRIREEAKSREFDGDYSILGSDIDPRAVETAKANASRAGVADIARFETGDARKFAGVSERGTLISNPPYGERLMEPREAEQLYREFGAAVRELEHWHIYLLSPHPEFENIFGKKANKRRKLYNGMIRCDLYIYN